MALVKSEAIILRTAKMGETSKLLTLYSLRDGILKLVAKGARSSKSRLGGALETLNIVEVVYYEKANRELQFLSQATIVFAPRQLLRDAERMIMAMVCAELVSRLETAQNPNPSIFGLLRATLEAFNQPAPDGRVLLFAFQLQLLRFLGFAPSLENCAKCGAGRSTHWKFYIAEGKLYCNNCFDGLNSGFSIRPTTLTALQKLAHTPVANLVEVQLQPAITAEIYHFLTAFYSHHLEEARFLRSLEVLKQMKAMEDYAKGKK